MKKAILLIAVLILVGSFVFAQDAGVKIGAWGRGIFTVVQSANPDPISQAMVSWGSPKARIGATISGNSANAGFQIDFNTDGTALDLVALGAPAGTPSVDLPGSLSFGDQQKIWIKPIDMITIQLGRSIHDNTLRGDAGAYGAFNWLRYSTHSGEDNVFARVRAQFELSAAPIEGLYAYIAFNPLEGGVKTEDMFKTGVYGAGYTIPNIGVVRAQYQGRGDNGTINAAFKLTAVQNLTVDVGGFIPTDTDVTPIKAAAQVNYNLDVLKLMANGNFVIPSVGDVAMEIGVGAEYGLGDGLAVQGDVRYANEASVDPVTANDGMVAGMVGITKGFSNGVIGLGVEISTTNFAGTPAQTADAIAWAIPLRLEYWF